MSGLITVNPSKVGLLMERIAFSYGLVLNRTCLLAVIKQAEGPAYNQDSSGVQIGHSLVLRNRLDVLQDCNFAGRRERRPGTRRQVNRRISS